MEPGARQRASGNGMRKETKVENLQQRLDLIGASVDEIVRDAVILGRPAPALAFCGRRREGRGLVAEPTCSLLLDPPEFSEFIPTE